MDDFYAQLAKAMSKANTGKMPDNRIFLDPEGNPVTEEELRRMEEEEAEDMVRKGAGAKEIARRQFTILGQGEIYKMYRKYGMNPDGHDFGF